MRAIKAYTACSTSQMGANPENVERGVEYKVRSANHSIGRQNCGALLLLAELVQGLCQNVF